MDRWLDALVRERRPRRFRANEEEAQVMQTAAALRAARPGAGEPIAAFVDGLARRLRRTAEAETLDPAGARRRRFLRASLLAAAAATAGVLGERVAERSSSEASPQGELVPEEGRWQAVTSTGSLQPGETMRFSAGGVEGFLVNRGGVISAISAVCTHMGCILAADPSGERLLCPCHGSSFSLDGAASGGGYAVARLARIRTRVRGGSVEVYVASPQTVT